MQKAKTREECLRLDYLNKTDISVLLDVSWAKAVKIYSKAKALDKEEFIDQEIEPSKVRLTSVLKVRGISFNLLAKQINSITSNSIMR